MQIIVLELIPMRSKKGITEKVWWPVLELILAIIIIFVTARSFVSIGTWYIGEKAGQITTANFNALTESINTLLESPDAYKAERNFPFYIEPKYAIAGFNPGLDITVASADPSTAPTSTIERPVDKCGDSACICILSSGITGYSSIKCTQFPNVAVIYSGLSSIRTNIPATIRNNFLGGVLDKGLIPVDLSPQRIGAQPHSLLIYGDYASSPIASNALGPINLYLEKYNDNGKNFLFIYFEDLDPTMRVDYLTKLVSKPVATP
jgi:hypothetical protein